MAEIDWDAPASLMRVTTFATAESQESLVARGTVRALVADALDRPSTELDGLVLRVAGPDGADDHDGDAIRELAARPGYTDAYGANDTAARGEDGDRWVDDSLPVHDAEITEPDATDGAGSDGEK